MLPFAGFLDKLRFSADEEDFSRQRYCSWDIASLHRGALASSSGAVIDVSTSIIDVDLEHYDYLVLFGSRNAQQCMEYVDDYRAFLRRAAVKNLKLVAIDNASFLLAAAGLLERCQVAVHWRHAREFASFFPAIEVKQDQLFCIDGKRITCAGGTAAIELAAELLAVHCGRERAFKGLADMLVDEARDSHHHLRSLDKDKLAIQGGSRHVARAIGLMRQSLSGTETIDVLGETLGLGRRQLDRLFMAQHGVTAKAYWQTMKLDHAQWRLRNSSNSLGTIAEEIGISDVSYFCRVFKRHFGLSPGEYRRRG
ncbi:AraC family transcriptional regulator [Photobacterium aquae]|uniref:AraC family transcriptional regulator n=2 Tax=Photobacterium aquae TaxID=1195763 RepID=A0A0J1JND3_9GAMM|nr:AraC family transcriptional regulator [Photobacterium aquae]